MPFKNHYYRGQELWLKRSGDTMLTGTTIVLGRAPTADLEAATKLYADQAARPQGSNQQFQFNDSLVFGGSPSLLYDKILHLVSIAPVAGDTVQIGRATTTGITFGDAATGDFVSIRPVSGGATYANLLSAFQSGSATPALRVDRSNFVVIPNSCSVGENGFGSVGGEAFVATSSVIGGTSENGGSSCIQINSNGNTSTNIQGRSRSTGVQSNRVNQLQSAGSKISDCCYTVVDGTFASVAIGCARGAFGSVTTNSWGLKCTDASPAVTINVAATDPTYFHGFEILAGATRNSGTQKLVNVGAHVGASGNAQYNRGIIVENGSVQIRRMALALVNGANDDIGPITSTIVRITGPTGAFNITSIRGGGVAADVPLDGEILILWNTTAQNMTITNAAATGTANNRITTSTGADLVTAGIGAVALFYDGADGRWHDFAFQP